MDSIPKYELINDIIDEIFHPLSITYRHSKKDELLKLLPHNETHFKHNVIDGVNNIIELCEHYKISIERTEWISIFYINLYGVIKEVEEIKTNSINYKIFQQQIDNTINMFSELNIYEQNKGNLKLSKKAEVLKNQFEKYLNRKILNSGLEKYFNIKTSYHVPTIDNIFTVAKSYLKRSIESHMIPASEAIDITKVFLEVLINKKRYYPDWKYKEIIINGYAIEYDIYMQKLSKQYIFKLI